MAGVWEDEEGIPQEQSPGHDRETQEPVEPRENSVKSVLQTARRQQDALSKDVRNTIHDAHRSCHLFVLRTAAPPAFVAVPLRLLNRISEVGASTAESNVNLDSTLRENRLSGADLPQSAHIKSLAEYEAEAPQCRTFPKIGPRPRKSSTGLLPGCAVTEGAPMPWPRARHQNSSTTDMHSPPAATKLPYSGRASFVRELHHGDLHAQVQRFANVLKGVPASARPRRHLHGHARARHCSPRLHRIGVHSVSLGRIRRSRHLRPRQRLRLRRCPFATQDTSYRRLSSIKG